MPEEKRPTRPERSSPSEPQPRPHHVADEPIGEVKSENPGVQSPTTETGLPVEEQIRKEWDPKKQGGLPTSLHPETSNSGAA